MLLGEITSLSNLLFDTRKGVIFLFLVSKFNNKDSCFCSSKIFIPILLFLFYGAIRTSLFRSSSEQTKRVGVSNSLSK